MGQGRRSRRVTEESHARIPRGDTWPFLLVRMVIGSAVPLPCHVCIVVICFMIAICTFARLASDELRTSPTTPIRCNAIATLGE